MTRTINVLLLFNTHKWEEVDVLVSERHVTLDHIYKNLPEKYKTEQLYKIIRLESKGTYIASQFLTLKDHK